MSSMETSIKTCQQGRGKHLITPWMRRAAMTNITFTKL